MLMALMDYQLLPRGNEAMELTQAPKSDLVASGHMIFQRSDLTSRDIEFPEPGVSGVHSYFNQGSAILVLMWCLPFGVINDERHRSTVSFHSACWLAGAWNLCIIHCQLRLARSWKKEGSVEPVETQT
jgi:hypothetical protein